MTAPMPDQRSVTEQLADLWLYARSKGMYDALDLIEKWCEGGQSMRLARAIHTAANKDSPT